MEKERKLTLKQRKWMKYYLESGNASDAARKAGYALIASGHENLEKPTVKAAFVALMDKKGLTDGKITDKLAELIEANKVISCNVIAKDNEGMADANSMTKDFIEVPDRSTQIKAVELLMKVKSLIGGDKTIIDRSHNQTNVLLQLRGIYEENSHGEGTVIDVAPEVS